MSCAGWERKRGKLAVWQIGCFLLFHATIFFSTKNALPRCFVASAPISSSYFPKSLTDKSEKFAIPFSPVLFHPAPLLIHPPPSYHSRHIFVLQKIKRSTFMHNMWVCVYVHKTGRRMHRKMYDGERTTSNNTYRNACVFTNKWNICVYNNKNTFSYILPRILSHKKCDCPTPPLCNRLILFRLHIFFLSQLLILFTIFLILIIFLPGGWSLFPNYFLLSPTLFSIYPRFFFQQNFQ